MHEVLLVLYQQTFVGTYSKVVHCKLYSSKTPITAADLLNDRVLPFFEFQGLPMLRILIDRGTVSASTSIKPFCRSFIRVAFFSIRDTVRGFSRIDPARLITDHAEVAAGQRVDGDVQLSSQSMVRSAALSRLNVR